MQAGAAGCRHKPCSGSHPSLTLGKQPQCDSAWEQCWTGLERAQLLHRELELISGSCWLLWQCQAIHTVPVPFTSLLLCEACLLLSLLITYCSAVKKGGGEGMASTLPPRESKMLHFVLVESKKSFISWSVRCITNCTIILFRGTSQNRTWSAFSKFWC